MTANERAQEGRGGRRLLSTLGLGVATAVYAVFATSVLVRAMFAPPGPAWERLLVGLARSTPAELALLVASGAAVAGSLWKFRPSVEMGTEP